MRIFLLAGFFSFLASPAQADRSLSLRLLDDIRDELARNLHDRQVIDNLASFWRESARNLS